MKSENRLFLIDGSSFCYRAFYAIRNLSTSKGQPTNAIYGVVVMLRKLIEEEKPEYLAVAFDMPKPTFRHQRYEQYKAHRKPMPEALVDQIPWIKEILKAYRIPLFEMEGYEADDVLGTMALQAAEKGFSVYLLTGDKDFLQLVGDNVRIYRPLKDGHEILDEQTLQDRWGLKPGQVVEVMALMGDETDAIPGVPGIGEKTAVELIRKHGTVENLLKQLGKPDSARPAVAKALQEHQDQLRMSHELATLDTAVPLSLKWEELKRQEPEHQVLRKLFQMFEFRSLVKELVSEEPVHSPLVFERLDSPEALKKVLSEGCKAGRVAIVPVVEGTAIQGQVVGVALSWDEGKIGVVPGEAAVRELKALWEDKTVLKSGPGLKEMQVLLLRHGIPAQGPWFDPGLASYLLDPTRSSHRIGDLALEFLGENPTFLDPLEQAAAQAQAAFRLTPRLQEDIEEKGMLVLLREVELPLAAVLARMEFQGIKLDTHILEELGKEIHHKLEGLAAKIYRLGEGEFNINSPKQLAEVLFVRLKLPIVKRTRTGASTDEEVLRRLSLLHDLPARILEYRELAKLSSTYIAALPEMLNPKTGRIHASFNQMVTATGRLSASNPNLQNIPIRTELGRRIRKAFVPSKDSWILLAADYSQIELRILAHLSRDEALVEAFRKGQDVHRVTASEVFQVPSDQVDAGQRAVAKTINFGILYGMSAFGLAKELALEQSHAQEFIEKYFSRYPRVRQYLEKSLEETRRLGYCVTLLNRRRYIPELKAKEGTVRQFAERMAINAPIQGSAADLIKVAMVALDAALIERGLAARMVCQVHDELILELPLDEREAVESLVRETMESPVLSGKPIQLRVPIQVNLKTGRNWYDVSH